MKPVEDELVAHLRGRQVMGVYPLLADDTTWLLAIDLDGRSWRADVAALREACSARGVVPAVERSRSGKGAHVWFFFSAPVPAGLADPAGRHRPPREKPPVSSDFVVPKSGRQLG